MTYHVHQIDSNLHKKFLAEKREDPVTQELIKPEDKVVFCSVCKSAFLEDSWKYIGEEHCDKAATLATIPDSPSNRRFSSKKKRNDRFRVINVSKNRQFTREPTPTNIQHTGTSGTTGAQYTVTPPTASNGSFAPAVSILGIVFGCFFGSLIIFVVGFGIGKFAINGNEMAAANSYNASVNGNNNRAYSSNLTVNRNNSVYPNVNKAVNVNKNNNSLSCVLYNNRSDENKVIIRSDCDIYDCDTDASTIIESLPDNTSINVMKGVSQIPSGIKPYSWTKVEIVDTGQIVWVADSKIKCE